MELNFDRRPHPGVAESFSWIIVLLGSTNIFGRTLGSYVDFSFRTVLRPPSFYPLPSTELFGRHPPIRGPEPHYGVPPRAPRSSHVTNYQLRKLRINTLILPYNGVPSG